MPFRCFVLALLVGGAVAHAASGQATQDQLGRLLLELNAVEDVGGACRMTFVARNESGHAIDQAVFETVIFDTSGGVVSLSLFDFRDLPADRPRVRQFDLPGLRCDTIGQALINGANTCLVDGAESDLCDGALTVGSRLSVELLG